MLLLHKVMGSSPAVIPAQAVTSSYLCQSRQLHNFLLYMFFSTAYATTLNMCDYHMTCLTLYMVTEETKILVTQLFKIKVLVDSAAEHS